MKKRLERDDTPGDGSGDKDKIIEQLSREREWLVHELNHRVRNILQVVSSLLNTQLHYLKDKAAIEATRENQCRVFTLSLIHMRLNNRLLENKVPMRWYIGELLEHLTDSYHVRNEIRFELQVEEIDLDMSQALSVGLIVHEAVCNSIKYAFPNPGRPVIRVALYHKGECSTTLSVSDNGIGIPTPFFAPGAGQVGLQLIRGLAGDLGASFQIRNDKGAMMNIEFTSTE